MHSSLPQQLTNFRFTRSSLITKAFEAAESYMVHGSKVVITICQELQDTVERMGVGDRSVLIENVMGGDVDAVAGPGRDALRAQWGIEPDAPLLLYTGTFEAYQGLELLLESVARLQKTHPHARQLIVGGASRSGRGAARARRGARRERRVHGAASAERDSALRRGVRHPRLAAHLRHQHAAEDLFVSALGTADRRDQSADAHAGARATRPPCSSSRSPRRSRPRSRA